MKSYGICDNNHTFNSWIYTFLKSLVMRKEKTKNVRRKPVWLLVN